MQLLLHILKQNYLNCKDKQVPWPFSSCSGKSELLAAEDTPSEKVEAPLKDRNLNRRQMAAYQRHYYSKKREYIVTKTIQRRGWSCSLGPGLEHKTYISVVSITTAFLCNLARMLQIWGIGLVSF